MSGRGRLAAIEWRRPHGERGVHAVAPRRSSRRDGRSRNPVRFGHRSNRGSPAGSDRRADRAVPGLCCRRTRHDRSPRRSAVPRRHRHSEDGSHDAAGRRARPRRPGDVDPRIPRTHGSQADRAPGHPVRRRQEGIPGSAGGRSPGGVRRVRARRDRRCRPRPGHPIHDRLRSAEAGVRRCSPLAHARGFRSAVALSRCRSHDRRGPAAAPGGHGHGSAGRL